MDVVFRGYISKEKLNQMFEIAVAGELDIIEISEESTKVLDTNYINIYIVVP